MPSKLRNFWIIENLHVNSMNLKERFKTAFPDLFYLENDLESLNQYLKGQHWLEDNEKIVALEKPGEGNMNVVFRLVTPQRRFIIKQSRPFVQKFPQIDAPMGRILVEARFLMLIGENPAMRPYTPGVIAFDPLNHILVLEDLGNGADYSYLYQPGERLSQGEIMKLVDYLNQLHRLNGSAFDFPANLAMRRLNHEHIFNFPFNMDNGFDLDQVQQGLQEAAAIYKQDRNLKNKIVELGEIYLSKGNFLLHGDYYPGSWLKVPSGVKVIDPEFAFMGRAEFDLGVFLAHLQMAQQGPPAIEQVLGNYRQPSNFDEELLAGFAGTEILRRLIGVAQLPLNLSLEEKKVMMKIAARWIETGKLQPLY